VPEIPISLSAVIAPCARPNAFFEVAASAELPRSAEGARNTVVVNLRVATGNATAYPFPVYTDPLFTVFVKFIAIATGNVQELGLKLSIDVCLQVLALPPRGSQLPHLSHRTHILAGARLFAARLKFSHTGMRLQVPGFDMFCGANLPTCDPLPSAYQLADGIDAKKAICMATNGYVNFRSLFANPPYVLASTGALGFNGVCALERRRLSVERNNRRTLTSAAVLSTPPAVPRLFGPHAHVDFYKYGGNSTNVYQPALPPASSLRHLSVAHRRHLQSQSDNSAGNTTNATNATDNGGRLPPLTIGVAGRVIIGSNESGFRADLTGEVDLQQGAATFTIAHDGGWSPIASLSDTLATPGFEGSVGMNVDGVPLVVAASVSLNEQLSLAGGMVEIGAVPCDQAFDGITADPLYDGDDCTEAGNAEGALPCPYQSTSSTRQSSTLPIDSIIAHLRAVDASCCGVLRRPDHGDQPHVPATDAAGDVLRDVWALLEPRQRGPIGRKERLLRSDLHR
jgi:hypothetical protein